MPGSLQTPTGGFLYDKKILMGLDADGWTVNVLDVGTGFPFPEPQTLQRAQDYLLGDGDPSILVVDGLALGVMPEAAARLSERRPLLALVHHPLYLETGLTDDQSRDLFETERIALSGVRGVITTSPETKTRVGEDFAVEAHRIWTVEPGFDRPDTLPPVNRDGPVRILSVGSLVPRKGHDRLIAALSDLTALEWTLTIVGADDRDPDHTKLLRSLIAEHGLHGRVILTGAIPDPALRDAYLSSDLFALASHYEGYGMAYAEAILHGLPVIGTTGGAITSTVPPGTGLLVAPDDPAALRDALRSMLADTATRCEIAERARRSGAAFQTWEDAARRFASILETVA
ncbi:MAG: glycosyltransferase family 4 protein [Pseudomonadota bacterium]